MSFDLKFEDSINALALLLSSEARVKGWHRDVADKEGAELRELYVPLWVANLHGELSELWESHRRGELHAPCDKKDSGLTQLEEEVADVFIRLLDGAYLLGVDVGTAVKKKYEYNKTRQYRHGNKIA